MIFRLPHPPLCFEIPDDWWNEMGAVSFVPTTQCFTWSDLLGRESVLIVPTEEIAPVLRRAAVTLDFFGLSPDGHVQAEGAGGMCGVLSAIVEGRPLPPVAVSRTRITGEGFSYKVQDGLHRFYASCAIGFSQIPCVIIPDVRPEPRFGDV